MNTFLFVLMFAVSVAVTAVFLHEIKCDIDNNTKTSKKTKSFRGIARCTAVLLIFIAAAEAIGVIKISEYK